MESKALGAQIQNLNEKLDCLRSLFEPRENSFINYEYKFNDVMDKIEHSVKDFGRFKVSNTYPPLCTAKFIDSFNNISLFNTMSTLSLPNCSNISFNSVIQTPPVQNTQFNLNQSFRDQSSTMNCSANLTIFIQIETVDYYGQKRTEGGDPVSILITDPYGRQQSLATPNQICDFKKGKFYLFDLTLICPIIDISTLTLTKQNFCEKSKN